MRKVSWLIVSFLLVLPFSLQAETLSLVPGLALEVELPGSRWVVSRQAPEFLIEETMEHLEHELISEGRKPDAAALKKATAKRLAANEAYIFNPSSGALLAIDFSALNEGEGAPGKKTIAASARLAGESLEGEEGVTDVRQKSSKTSVNGGEIAYRIDATFHQHGEPRNFIGIVGFRAPYWFYLYYTDPQRDPGDKAEMEQILKTLSLRSASGS